MQGHDIHVITRVYPATLTRNTTVRERYEVEAREIRYSTYKETLFQTQASAVLLGHHRGDVEVPIA
jgi:tRNA(Ile)-lysidine synthase TilS/MesJ